MRSLGDYSVGQRLAAGFGLLGLVFAFFTASVLGFQMRAEQSEQAILDRIIPRAESARAMESAVLGVAIAMRALLLQPAPEREREALARIDEARAALAHASQLPREADGEAIFTELRPAMRRYLEEAGALAVSAATRTPDRPAAEALLARLREEAVRPLRAYSDLQRDKTRRALGEIERARKRVATSVYASFAAMALVLAALGYLITRSIRDPARELVRVAARLQEGDWGPALAFAPAANERRGGASAPRDELARIRLAFGAAAQALEKREKRLQADARVAAAISSSLDRREVAEGALKAMAEAVGAAAGAVYWRDDETLEPAASLALPAAPATLGAGEGVPGRAAREGRVVVLGDIPPDTPMQLRLGVDEAPPRAVVAVPAIARGEVFGVAVLASLRPFDAAALEFLQAAGMQLGIGLSNVRAHEEAQRLLEELRESHEQVQAQNEELQAQSEELQAQSEELQAQSEELQAQNEELQRTTAELARADERKNHFLGVLAHELRNPLAAIASSLHILGREEPRSPAEATGLEVIARQMGHLTRLIDDLLDVTRIAHGKIDLQREALDLAALVRDGVADARSAAAKAQVALNLEAPAHPVPVHGDPTRLAQVLGNLVSNALKFTDPGGRIDVRVEAHGETAVLRVRDTGIGFDESLKATLFEAFSQGPQETRRGNGGLGLGLALSKALVALHGGTIAAESAGPGRGSEFIVTLPLREVAAPQPPSPRAEPVARIARDVLVVEDNPDAAAMLRLSLEMEGHHVRLAASGPEAIEKACAAPPDIVLCDLGIPGIDGFEVARRLRGIARLKGLPLVALSGHASPEDRARSAHAGFTEHLCKPVAMNVLLELIERLVRPPHGEAPREKADVAG